VFCGHGPLKTPPLGLRKAAGVERELPADSIHSGSFEEEALAGTGFHGTGEKLRSGPVTQASGLVFKGGKFPEIMNRRMLWYPKPLAADEKAIPDGRIGDSIRNKI
jgi:hypothetical protein